MSLSGGFAAGGGADALEEILKLAHIKQTERRRAKQDDRRLGQEDTRLAQQAEMQKASLASLDDSRKEAAQDREMRTIQGMLQMMPPGAAVDPGLAARGRAAGFGGMLPHEGADLPSTAISGMATTGAKAPLVGRLSMTAAGRPERDTFTGTAQQHAAEQVRTDRQTQLNESREDRLSRDEQTRQARTDAATAAQTGREDLARLTASLRPGPDPIAHELAAQRLADLKTKAAPPAGQSNEVQDSLSLIDEIRRDPALKKSVGPAEGRGAGYVTAGPEGYTRVKALHDNLVNKLQLAQAGKLKGQGQISNMEREMLKNAATALDRTLGDADYLKQLAKIETQFKRMLAPAAGPAAGDGVAPKVVRYDMNGNPIK